LCIYKIFTARAVPTADYLNTVKLDPEVTTDFFIIIKNVLI